MRTTEFAFCTFLSPQKLAKLTLGQQNKWHPTHNNYFHFFKQIFRRNTNINLIYIYAYLCTHKKKSKSKINKTFL